MGRQSYKQKFDQLYEQSPPEARALFDDPSTREKVPELYEAYKRSQTPSVRSRNHKRTLDMKAATYDFPFDIFL